MKKVYEYIKENKIVAVNEVAIALNITGTDVLSMIEELRTDGYVKMISPVPLSTDNNESCYYTRTDKEYRDC